MMRFPYLPEAFTGAPPRSWPAGSGVSWRPLAPIRIIGPSGRSVDTGFQVRWRGQSFALRFGRVELELTDGSGAIWRWPAIIVFSPAPMRYPILGNAGCLCSFDVLFRGDDRVVDLETNRSYSGTKS